MFEILKKRFATMDPTLLAAAWKVVAQAHAKDIRVTIPGLENSQKVSLEAKLLDPKDALVRRAHDPRRGCVCAHRLRGAAFAKASFAPPHGKNSRLLGHPKPVTIGLTLILSLDEAAGAEKQCR